MATTVSGDLRLGVVDQGWFFGTRLVRLGGTSWAGAAPGVKLQPRAARRRPKAASSWTAQGPGLIDAQVQVPAPTGEAGSDMQEPVTKGRRFGLGMAPSRHTMAVQANRS